MKKALAILLTFVMLFTLVSANVFANETTELTAETTVTVDDEEVILAGEKTTLEVKLSNFENYVKGMDMIIYSEDGVVFNSLKADKNILFEKSNYTLKDHEIHIVDLTENLDTEKLCIEATVNSDAKVTLEAALAKSGEEYFKVTDDAWVRIVGPALEGEAGSDEEIKEKYDGYFMPYGGVFNYNRETKWYTYIYKELDATFKVNLSEVYWRRFKIPEGGFGTFGISNSINTKVPAIQFGTYSNKLADNVQHGTFIIAGDWEELKVAKKPMTEAQLVEKLSQEYDKNIVKDDITYDYVQINFNKKANSVRLYKVAQVNYMWKNNEDLLEYALRVNNVSTGDYAAVGYYIDSDGNVHFSENVIATEYIAANS